MRLGMPLIITWYVYYFSSAIGYSSQCKIFTRDLYCISGSCNQDFREPKCGSFDMW